MVGCSDNSIWQIVSLSAREAITLFNFERAWAWVPIQVERTIYYFYLPIMSCLWSPTAILIPACVSTRCALIDSYITEFG